MPYLNFYQGFKKWLWLWVLLGVIASGGVFYVLSVFPQQTIALTEPRLYTVAKGIGFNQLCRDLVAKQVIARCGPLKWFTKLQPKLRDIKAGVYQIKPNINHLQLLNVLISGAEY